MHGLHLFDFNFYLQVVMRVAIFMTMRKADHLQHQLYLFWSKSGRAVNPILHSSVDCRHVENVNVDSIFS